MQLLKINIMQFLRLALSLGVITVIAFGQNAHAAAGPREDQPQLEMIWNSPTNYRLINFFNTLLRFLGISCNTEESETFAATIPALTRSELPELSKDQLIKEINNTKKLLPQEIFNALTIPHDKKILVIGDIHAGCEQLIATINKMREDGRFKPENPWQLQNNYHLILTGDLADRGTDGLGVWQIAMNLVQNNPNTCLIMRGNHETSEMACTYGFYSELFQQYPEDTYQEIVDAFNSLFDTLPNILFLGIRLANNHVSTGIYCHGGLDLRLSPASVQGILMESVQHPEYHVISKGTDEMKIDESAHSFSRTDNGFNWSEFNRLRHGRLFAWGIRGGVDGYNISPAGVAATLQSYSTPEASVDYIARGHHHTAGCVNKFNASTGRWDPLNTQQIIQPGSIFSFMCLSPEAHTYDGTTNKQAGYGLIESNQANQLTITPFIAHERQRSTLAP